MEDTASRPIHMPGRSSKLETQNEKEDQISIRTTPDNAESEVFLEKVTLYGEVAIKSRYLEAKPLKFSPPKSLCGTVRSPWVSPATLFGFWETLIKFSESMILYGDCFRFFFFSSIQAPDKNSSLPDKKYVDNRSQNVRSLFNFCKSSRQVNEDAWGILR